MPDLEEIGPAEYEYKILEGVCRFRQTPSIVFCTFLDGFCHFQRIPMNAGLSFFMGVVQTSLFPLDRRSQFFHGWCPDFLVSP